LRDCGDVRGPLAAVPQGVQAEATEEELGEESLSLARAFRAAPAG
jgi:hypothetical protein